MPLCKLLYLKVTDDAASEDFQRPAMAKNGVRVVQVPVLFDKQTMTIVSNESADVIRMFATECKVGSCSRVLYIPLFDALRLLRLLCKILQNCG